MAGGVEAGDRGGIVGAGFVCFGCRAALRRQRKPGFRLASALWDADRSGSSSCATRAPASAGPGNDWSGARQRRSAAVRIQCRRHDHHRSCRHLPRSCGREFRGARAPPCSRLFGSCRRRAGEGAMIPTPSDVRVWLAVGRTDMRRGMNGLALQVQEALQRDPHVGDLFVFRGCARRPDQDPLARRPRAITLRQAAGARSICVATKRCRAIVRRACARGTRGVDFCSPACVSPVRDRLAQPGADVPATACWITLQRSYFVRATQAVL